jgi:16S rRNA A1518/A1519 N6-dimethyltransferase RsmA/KsgA/DIM1 with predicted DNA glycosylase/AP lyase activity
MSLKRKGNKSSFIAQTDIDPTRRAETLSIQEFVRLAELYDVSST